jgi:hypothetical protein
MVFLLIALGCFWQFFSASAEQRRLQMDARPMTGLVIACLFLVGAVVELVTELH